jgi:AcrR family transcriptional regulator
MDVRTRILDAALGLLAKGGARELTQPRVSRAAGIRQSHLTYYFPTVNELLQAVARHSVDALTQALAREGARGAGSFAEAIAAGSADKSRVRVMLGLVAAADRDASLKPRLREFIDELRAMLAPALRAGGLAATPEEVAFLHSVVIGQALLQLARDNEAARAEARRVIEMAAGFLRRRD